jgi:hypothetical protein
MAAHEWEQRLNAIRREKHRILHDKLFFSMLEKHISGMSRPRQSSVHGATKPGRVGVPGYGGAGEWV